MNIEDFVVDSVYRLTVRIRGEDEETVTGRVQIKRSGKLRLCLRGKSARLARAMQVTEHSLSLSHSDEYALALVLLVVKT